MRNCGSGLVMFVVLLVVTATGQAGPVFYSVTDLGDLPGGENHSIAFAINNSGQVVGRSETAEGTRAFLWQNDVMTNLGVLTLGDEYSMAYDINDAGDVVGQSAKRAFLYSGGNMSDVGTLGGDYGIADGISNNGEIVGISSDENGVTHAFRLRNDTMHDLDTRTDNYSRAYAINDVGQITGVRANPPDWLDRGFIWSDGTMTDLGELPGGPEKTRAYAINKAGQVVGESAIDSATVGHAFLWHDGVMVDLGVLPGTDSSLARGLNDHSQVVGRSYNHEDEGYRAFLWGPSSGMRDLNDLFDTSTANWLLFEAMDINETGQIVGHGINPSGSQHAFLLTPVSLTPQLFAGDANQDLEFNFDDILMVLAAGKFETGQPATWSEGDWNGAPGGSPGNPPLGDGVFNFNDILAALGPGPFETGPYAKPLTPQPAVDAVPEPSTFLLAVVALLSVAAGAWKRRLQSIVDEQRPAPRRIRQSNSALKRKAVYTLLVPFAKTRPTGPNPWKAAVRHDSPA